MLWMDVASVDTVSSPNIVNTDLQRHLHCIRVSCSMPVPGNLLSF